MPWPRLYLDAVLVEAIVARKASATREKRRLKSSRRLDRNRKPYTLPFQSRHYQMFGVGLVTILAGFIALGFGSITLAPLLMVVGYCVLIPLILFWKADTEEAATSERRSPQS